MKTQPIKIYARDSLYIRSKALSQELREEIRERYTMRFYEDKACNKCEHVEEKHSDLCDVCPAYKGAYMLSKDVKVKEKKYITVPFGDKDKFQSFMKKRGHKTKYVPKFKSDDDLRMRKRIKFLAKLRDYQPKAVAAVIEGGSGVLKAPPRSGKTVMGTAAICKLGVKTLILASQRDWLMGFYETFCGSKTQTAMTNAVGGGATVAGQRAFKKTGKKAQVAFCKTLEDFENADVCLATVQTFHSEAGQKLLKKIKAMFGLIIVDEIQYGAASKYASILSKFVCPRKVGLTGTDSRKDQKFIIVRMLLGENLFEVKVKRLRPRIRLTRTKFVDNSKNFNWVRFVTKLEMDKARQKLIAEQAIKDMKAGHLVLIPFARVKATLAMVQLINKKVGKRVAAAFIGAGTEKKGESRDDILQKAREYKIKILVGTAKILSVGVNIPRASALFDVSPSSNIENCEQRTSRVLTPMDDKPDPIIRYFLDDSGVRKSCMANEYWKCVHPTFKPIVSEKDMEVLKGYFSRKKESDFIDL